jgi:hypothetical protein
MKGWVRDLFLSFLGSLLTLPVALLLPSTALDSFKGWVSSNYTVTLSSPRVAVVLLVYCTAVLFIFLVRTITRLDNENMARRRTQLYGYIGRVLLGRWHRRAILLAESVAFPIEEHDLSGFVSEDTRIGEPECAECHSSLRGSVGRFRFFYSCANPICHARRIALKRPLRETQEALEDQLHSLGLQRFFTTHQQRLRNP